MDIPPFFIKGEYVTASYATGRRPELGATPVHGMNTDLMISYADHISQYVEEPSILLMDRLSSHTSKKARSYIESLKTKDGRQKFFVMYFPTKAPFLISPLDTGALTLFKKNYYRYDRSTLKKKKRAAYLAWREVTNDNLVSFFKNCGLVGKKRITTLIQQFMTEVRGAIPAKHMPSWDYYDAWKCHAIEVERVFRPRGSPLDIPLQIPEAELDGNYWVNYQGVRK